MDAIKAPGIDHALPPRQVKHFYNTFRDEKLVRDFRKINLRQQAAIQLVRSTIPRNARALEIGCGVGIITRALISRVSFMLAIDISEANIQLAQRVLRTAKAEFGIFDVVTDDPRWVADRGPFDAVLLIDTIEHITSGEHEALFARIERWLKPGGYVIVTYPSPEYQTFLHNEQPTKLQIIDEIVRLGEIALENHFGAGLLLVEGHVAEGAVCALDSSEGLATWNKTRRSGDIVAGYQALPGFRMAWPKRKDIARSPAKWD